MAKTPDYPVVPDFTQEVTAAGLALKKAQSLDTAAKAKTPPVAAETDATGTAVTSATTYQGKANDAATAAGNLTAAIATAKLSASAAAAAGATDAQKAQAVTDRAEVDAKNVLLQTANQSMLEAKADALDKIVTAETVAAAPKDVVYYGDVTAAADAHQALGLTQATAVPSTKSWGTGSSDTLPAALATPDLGASQKLAKIVYENKMVQLDASPDHAINLLAVYADQLANGMIAGKTALQTVNARIAALDKTISSKMDTILHDPGFQKLEAAWRGLQYLVMNSETGEMMKLRLLNVTKKELNDDFEKQTDYDQSAMFKKVYEEEYGTFGGYPFSVLVGDYEFGRTAEDMALLTNISGVAASAHAPFLAAADPKLFDMASFTELANPRDLAKQFDSTELIKWKSFRDSEDSRYVALTLPHVLMRMPYGDNFTPVETFAYTETTTPPVDPGTTTPTGAGLDMTKFLWGNSSYALAQRITNAFSLYGWCAAIRGSEGGGMVEGLPTYTFKTSDGLMTLTCPTETTITDRRENELSKLGFIAIVHKKNTDQAVFFGGQTANKPILYDLDDANANAALSARLPYILATSRFAHYIKVMMRDKIGSFATKENVSTYLNQFLARYILLNDDAPQAVKAAYPLREGRVDVFDIPGKPGSYTAVVYLRPHFQLEELTVSMRLVATLPAPAK